MLNVFIFLVKLKLLNFTKDQNYTYDMDKIGEFQKYGKGKIEELVGGLDNLCFSLTMGA
jgi:hypothetical protein